MEHVVCKGADLWIREVAEHPDVGRQEQHGEQPLRGAIPRVEEDGKSKQHRSLQPKEESRKSAHDPIAGNISLGILISLALVSASFAGFYCAGLTANFLTRAIRAPMSDLLESSLYENIRTCG